jgi:hypothetical protein
MARQRRRAIAKIGQKRFAAILMMIEQEEAGGIDRDQ